MSRDIVETYHPLSTQIGYEILKQGGNAFDAFIAATAADYVLGEGVTSLAGPLGVLVYDAETNSAHYLNAAFNDPLDPKQKWSAQAPKPGGAALVPGAIAGLEALSQKYGKLPFRAVLKPAIDLAQNGFPLTSHYAGMINLPLSRAKLRRTAYGQKTFFRNGQPLKEGDTLKLPELADFLTRLATEGSAYAYTGAWAQACLKVVNDQGGHLTSKDFSSYKVRWEDALEMSYRGYDLFFPKTHGAMVSSMALKIIEPEDLQQLGEHYTKSAQGLAIVDLAYIAASQEPWLHDYQKLNDESFLKTQLSPAHIETMRAWTRKQIKASPAPEKGTHSLQVTVIDHDGNAVTGTNTIEGMPWGEGLFVQGVPLTSSNELTSFSTAPGKRRRFSLSMHIAVKDQKVRLASGTFNSSLIPAEYQLLINLINYQMSSQEAVTVPRFGAQAWSMDTMKSRGGQWLDPRVSPEIVSELTQRGLSFVQIPPIDTGLGAVAIVNDDGSTQGAIAPLSLMEDIPQVGIGAALELTNDHRIMVTRVAPNSPAEKAGIQTGDIIISVQKTLSDQPVPLQNKEPQDAIVLIRGPKDTPLVLQILKSLGQTISIQLVRDIYLFKSN